MVPLRVGNTWKQNSMLKSNRKSLFWGILNEICYYFSTGKFFTVFFKIALKHINTSTTMDDVGTIQLNQWQDITNPSHPLLLPMLKTCL